MDMSTGDTSLPVGIGAQRTNAEIFASSFSGKWGDYDPQGMAGWSEQ
jgi:hypothetical protein